MNVIKKVMLIFIITLFVFLLVVQVAASFLLRPILEKELRNIFDVPVYINHAGANLFRASFWMKGIRFKNPAGFKEQDAITGRTVSIDLSLLSFLTNELVVTRIQFKDPQFILEINKQGESNFNYFMDKAIQHFQAFEKRKPKIVRLITQYTLEKFSVRNGDFQLIDYSQPERNWVLRSISFSLARIVHPGDPEEVMPTAIYMNASVPGPVEGQVLILGRLNPFVPKNSFDITASVRNLVFNQYSGLAHEFPLNFQEGTLQLKVKAVGHENQVDILYQVRVERLKFTLKETDQKKPPLVFGLAPATLVRFFNDVHPGEKPFEFEFRVTGSLEDPKFDFWRETEDQLGEIISERITTEMQTIKQRTGRVSEVEAAHPKVAVPKSLPNS